MQNARMLKKPLALLLSLLMLCSMLPMAAFAAGSDISGHWAEETLQKWSDKGWFTGDGDGTYRPNAGITRAEFMALINRMEGYEGKSAAIAEYGDVSPDAWYYSTVSAALAAGYINGTGKGTMSPMAQITRQEAMTIIARTFGLNGSDTAILAAATDGAQVADWAKNTVADCINAGLVAGAEGKINPTANITRAESVVLMDRVNTNVRTYSFAGTYGPASGSATVAAVNVLGADVRLQNMTVSGDLTIGKAVGEGEVYLSNVAIKGALNVQGGGMDSVYLDNCTINELIIEKDKVHVVLENGSTITFARTEGEGDFIELKGNTTIGTLTITGEETLVKMEAGVSVTTLNANADGVSVETQKGTTIGTANITGETEISGEGKITTANINAEGVVIENKPTTTNVNEGVTANVGGSDVAGTTKPSTGGSGGGGGGGNGSGTTVSYQSHNVAAKTVSYGTVAGDLALPSTVTLTANTGAIGTADVTWSYSAYNATTAGEKTITGTLSNATVTWAPATITVKVTVLAALTVTGGTEIADVIVPTTVDASTAADKLPASVTLTLSDGSTAVASLSWTVSGTYSNEAGKVNIFSATVSGLAANVVAPTISANVIVAASDISTATSVTLTATPASVQRPTNDTNATVALSAVVKDQFGDEMTGVSVGYSLVDNTDTGIAYGPAGSEATPTVTITQASTAASVKVKVEVTADTAISDEITITISNEALVPTSIAFTNFVSSMTLPALGTTMYTFAAVVHDQNGVAMSEPVSFSIKQPVPGVTVEANGLVTIGNTAANGASFVVVATGGELTAEKTVTIVKEASTAFSVAISGSQTINLPGTGKPNSTETYTAVIKDQYGVEMTGEVTWELEAAKDGVSIDENTGVLTVTAAASEGAIAILAKHGSLTGRKAGISITKAASVATSIAIEGLANVNIPTADVQSANYVAEVKDQYGAVMSDQTVTWSVSGVTGVSIAPVNTPHKAELSVPTTASEGTAIITATCGAATTTKEVAIAKAASVLTMAVVTGPATIAAGGTGTYTAKAVDQYNVEMSGQSFTWSISPEGTGISVDQNGVVSVASTVAADTTFTVKAVVGDKEDVATGKVTAAAGSNPVSAVTAIKFIKDANGELKLTWGEPESVENISGLDVYFGVKDSNEWKKHTANMTPGPCLGISAAQFIAGKSETATYQVKIVSKATQGSGYTDAEIISTATLAVTENTTPVTITSAVRDAEAKTLTIGGTFIVGTEYLVGTVTGSDKPGAWRNTIATSADSITAILIDEYQTTATVQALTNVKVTSGSAEVTISVPQSTPTPITTSGATPVAVATGLKYKWDATDGLLATWTLPDTTGIASFTSTRTRNGAQTSTTSGISAEKSEFGVHSTTPRANDSIFFKLTSVASAGYTDATSAASPTISIEEKTAIGTFTGATLSSDGKTLTVTGSAALPQGVYVVDADDGALSMSRNGVPVADDSTTSIVFPLRSSSALTSITVSCYSNKDLNNETGLGGIYVTKQQTTAIEVTSEPAQLPAPTGVSVEKSDSDSVIFLRWNAVEGAENYAFVATGSSSGATHSFTEKGFDNGNGTRYINAEVFIYDLPADTYSFQVQALTAGGAKGPLSQAATTTVTITASPALTNITAAYVETELVVSGNFDASCEFLILTYDSEGQRLGSEFPVEVKTAVALTSSRLTDASGIKVSAYSISETVPGNIVFDITALTELIPITITP